MRAVKQTILFIGFLLLTSSLAAKNNTDAGEKLKNESVSPELLQNLNRSAGFEFNDGQYDDEFQYRFSGTDACVDFYSDRVVFSLRKQVKAFNIKDPMDVPQFDFVHWEISLNDSRCEHIEGIDMRNTNVNYFGKDGRGIKRKLARELIYRDVYPNIDLRFYTNEAGQFKYDFILHPGAKLSDIDLQYKGVDDLKVLDDGRLEYLTAWGTIAEDAPYSYTEDDKEELDIRYKVKRNKLKFEAEFDEVDRTVVLDPIYVDWSTYFYGSGQNGLTWAYTYVMDLDMDDSGYVYVTGVSNDIFPTPATYDTVSNGFYDAYICKVTPDGDSIVWFSYIGGSYYEWSYTLAVNNMQQPVIAGFTWQGDFPVTQGAFDVTPNGTYNGFVTKFSENGDSLIFSTYFGGSNWTMINSIALDGAGNVYMTGRTASSDFPITAGCYQSTYGGSTSNSWWTGGDAYLTKLNAQGTALGFSTFIGGAGDDEGIEIALSPANDIYIVGKTTSSNFPVTPGSTIFNTSLKGAMDGFICKFYPNGNTVHWSKMMGGNGTDWFEGVYVNSNAEAYVAGISNSSNFYTTTGAYQRSNKGGHDIVVVKFNKEGHNVHYSTYIGGSGDEFYYSGGWWGNSNVRIAANIREEAIVCAISRSNNFPVTSDALMSSNPSSYGTGWWNSAATISKLNHKGTELLYGTYFGGSSFEFPGANRLKRTSCYTNILYGGFTNSSDYPTTTGVYRENRGSNSFYTGFISAFRDTLYTDLIDFGLEDTLIECDQVYEILDAQNIGADILWSTGSTYNLLIAEDTGTYWVQATYGCDTVRDTITLMLEYSPTVPVLPEDSVYCDTFPSLTLDARNDTIMATYLWSTGDTTQTIDVDTAGTYKVTMTTPHCGEKSDEVIYVLRRTPLVDLPADSIFCDSVSIVLNVGYADNDEFYNWGDTDSIASRVVTDTGWYGVSITNMCGVDTGSFHASVLMTPNLLLPVDSEFCNTINYPVVFGLKDNEETYTITDILNNRSLVPSDSIVITDPALYEFTISNTCGLKRDTLDISLLLTPGVDLGNDTTYCDQVAYSIDERAPLNKEIYLWENGSVSPVRSISQAGEYWLQIENKCGTVRDSILIELVETPLASLPADSVFCDQVSMVLDASITEPSSYEWQDGSTSTSFNVSQEGKYWVTITNYCGASTDTMNIGMITTPIAALGSDKIYCDMVVPTELSAGKQNNEEIYQWSNNSSMNTASFSTEGKHWVLITNKCGSSSDTIDFILSPNPVVDLGPDTTLCGRFEVILDAGNPGMQYLWEPYGETTQTIKATEQRVYRVTVYNEYGCEGSDEYLIGDDCISKMYIPSAFSPNDDGMNDLFKPTLVNYQDFKMEIYTRWGEKIFETTDPNTGWDGKVDGEFVPNGVYLYTMYFITTENMMPQNIEGLLNVLR